MYWERWAPYPYEPADLPDPDALPYYEGYNGWVEAYGPIGQSDWVEAGAIPIRVILEQASLIVDGGLPRRCSSASGSSSTSRTSPTRSESSTSGR